MIEMFYVSIPIPRIIGLFFAQPQRIYIVHRVVAAEGVEVQAAREQDRVF